MDRLVMVSSIVDFAESFRALAAGKPEVLQMLRPIMVDQVLFALHTEAALSTLVLLGVNPYLVSGQLRFAVQLLGQAVLSGRAQLAMQVLGFVAALMQQQLPLGAEGLGAGPAEQAALLLVAVLGPDVMLQVGLLGVGLATERAQVGLLQIEPVGVEYVADKIQACSLSSFVVKF